MQAQSAAALASLQKSCQAAKSMVAAGRVDDAFNIANSIDPNILKVHLTRADVILASVTCLPLPRAISQAHVPHARHGQTLWLLQDLRLQYTLKTRKFVETLRPRTPEALKEALGLQTSPQTAQTCLVMACGLASQCCIPAVFSMPMRSSALCFV